MYIKNRQAILCVAWVIRFICTYIYQKNIEIVCKYFKSNMRFIQTWGWYIYIMNLILHSIILTEILFLLFRLLWKFYNNLLKPIHILIMLLYLFTDLFIIFIYIIHFIIFVDCYYILLCNLYMYLKSFVYFLYVLFLPY